MRYLVMIRRTSTGYSVDVPDLPGCIATAISIEQAKQMIAQAIEMHVEAMQSAGESIPSPTSSIQFTVDDLAPEELCTWVEVDVAEIATR